MAMGQPSARGCGRRGRPSLTPLSHHYFHYYLLIFHYYFDALVIFIVIIIIVIYTSYLHNVF